MARNGHMGAVPGDVKRQRRQIWEEEMRRPRAAFTRFLKRRHVKREVWDAPPERKPVAHARARLQRLAKWRAEYKQWLEERALGDAVFVAMFKKKFPRIVERPQETQRRVGYERRKAKKIHRRKSWEAYGRHLTARCREECEEFGMKSGVLWKLSHWYWEADAGYLPQRELERQRDRLFTQMHKCERRCYDAALGRRYRAARGWEKTGEKTLKREHVATVEKYKRLSSERRGTATPAQRSRLRRERWLASDD